MVVRHGRPSRGLLLLSLCCLGILRRSIMLPMCCVEGWTNSHVGQQQAHKRSLSLSVLMDPTTPSSSTTTTTTAPSLQEQEKQERIYRLQGKLLKSMRKFCKEYNMIEAGDHIMVCVSGGKDSAVLLYLMMMLQKQLEHSCPFTITAVHVDQKQPGYNGKPLVDWLESLKVPYKIIEEDTYSIVLEKTPARKTYCTICSRLRRGILYTQAQQLENCTKLALGHHADDAMETLLLNMMHAGQCKGMPARYTAERGNLSVLRPLIGCMEATIEEYAQLQGFPILPCNLCKNQDEYRADRTASESVQNRPQIKLLLASLEALNPNVRVNMLKAMTDIRPSHLLDQNLRQSCGMDPITGDVLVEGRTGTTSSFDDEADAPLR